MLCVISSSGRLHFDEANTSGMAHNNILNTDSINLAPCGCSSYFGDDPQCTVTVQNIQAFVGADLSLASCSLDFYVCFFVFALPDFLKCKPTSTEPHS